MSETAHQFAGTRKEAGSSYYVWLLPTLLSVIAGTADVISFLGLGLFNAHATGNLVILAAHVVGRGVADMALILSVPVFIVVLFLTKLLVVRLEAREVNPLTPLLVLQFGLLAAFTALCASSAHALNANAGWVAVGSQLGVAAMAVQNALVQLTLKGVPSTAVMTTNITRFMMDLGEVVLRPRSDGAAAAGQRAKQTLPVILGFTAGAALGAGCFAVTGLQSLALPTGLALIALVVNFLAKPAAPQGLAAPSK